MNQLAEEMRLESAIEYWSNCRGKGTAEQQVMVERTLRDLRSRLDFSMADAAAERDMLMVTERE